MAVGGIFLGLRDEKSNKVLRLAQSVVGTRLLVFVINYYGRSVAWKSLPIATDYSMQGSLAGNFVLTHGRVVETGREGQRR